MKIHILITKNNYIELITDSHKQHFPKESHSSDLAYDYCVCPKDPEDRLPCIVAGGCEWQCCGYEEYSDDLPANLIAGRIAYEIRLDREAFLVNPSQWLKDLSEMHNLQSIEFVVRIEA